MILGTELPVAERRDVKTSDERRDYGLKIGTSDT